MLQESYPTLDMFLGHSESKLWLKKEYVSNFHDVIINAAHNAMDKHIPHMGDRKPKVIPGWDIEMVAHDNPHYFGTICGTSVGKNNHYKLRALRKNKQNKTKLSVCKTMLRNSPTTH